MKPKLNDLQAYLAQEFVDDYHEGHMTRREMMRRVLGITGGIAATASVLLALGCQPAPAATPTSAPAASAASPTPAPSPTTAASPTTSASPTAEASPMAAASPTTAAAKPTAPAAMGPRSPFSVAEDDPAITAEDITFPGDDATLMGYLVRPASGDSFAAVLVCHENRGLVEHIRDVTRRVAKAGYVALAVDLLSRDGGTPQVDPAEAPGKLSADPERNVADFQAAFRHLGTLDFVDIDRVGMVGFCLGGNVTWRTATAIPELKAAVPFYGPNPPIDDVPKINAAVLAIYGGNDERVNAGIPAIEEAMAANDKTFEKIIYPGANHAFHNDTGPNWNEEAATDAWEKTLDWFATYLA